MRLNLFNHILEIAWRLYYILWTIFFSFISCLIFFQELSYLLTKPLLNLIILESNSFIYTHMTEIFFTWLNNSFFISLLCSLPVIYIHIWLFIIPGLYEFERKKVFYYLSGSLTLLILGFLLGYYILIPLTWKFFLELEFNSPLLMIKFIPKINEYFEILISTGIWLILSFQLPLLFLILVKWNLISLEKFIYSRHLSILYCLIIGALLSPPDVYSQLFMALPTWFFYEFTIFILILKKNRAKIHV